MRFSLPRELNHVSHDSYSKLDGESNAAILFDLGLVVDDSRLITWSLPLMFHWIIGFFGLIFGQKIPKGPKRASEGTRTLNLRLRRPTRYPLRHGGFLLSRA